MTEREVKAKNPAKYPTKHRRAPPPSPAKTDLALQGNRAKMRQTPCARGDEGLSSEREWEELNVWELNEADSPVGGRNLAFSIKPQRFRDLQTRQGIFDGIFHFRIRQQYQMVAKNYSILQWLLKVMTLPSK